MNIYFRVNDGVPCAFIAAVVARS